jgi:hypothetical protein
MLLLPWGGETVKESCEFPPALLAKTTDGLDLPSSGKMTVIIFQLLFFLQIEFACGEGDHKDISSNI